MEVSHSMALDGLVIANVVHELSLALTEGRINKIHQPEADELILTIKNNRETFKLLLSASASLPLIYLTSENKTNPMVAPNFCMLLRKHLSGGRIINICQPEMERVIRFEIEHLNELGDLCTKFLTIELMGKHSNIIFMQPDNTIIDSIKHISHHTSSVREVLPGCEYFIPSTQDKTNPLQTDEGFFLHTVLSKPLPVGKAIFTSFNGISPLIAEELCNRASVDSSISTKGLSDIEKLHLYKTFERFIDDIKNNQFTPNIVYKNDVPMEFSSTLLTCYGNLESKTFDSICKVLETYYAQKNTITRIRQKSSDLRRIVGTAIDRTRKKHQIQLKQIEDTKKREKYKIYGELINTYGYDLEPGSKALACLNYYTNEEITIPLDPQLTPKENSIRYFDRYNKLKRTFEASQKLVVETKAELDHLESISASLDIALAESDLTELKEELIQYGYIKRKHSKSKQKTKITSKPFHYVSSDGFHMYVGKNNFQNEEITFNLASGNDWWFHAKGIPGSHVIVKSDGKELPDSTFEEAGRLAAYYSKGRNAKKVEIDYIQRKYIKKPPAAKPGFVIYHTNYSLMIEPDISQITEVQ